MKINTTQADTLAKFAPLDEAYATGRCLPGQYSHGNQQEWAQRGSMGGQPVTVYWIFENSECDSDDASDYPFDAGHIDRIIAE